MNIIVSEDQLAIIGGIVTMIAGGFFSLGVYKLEEKKPFYPVLLYQLFGYYLVYSLSMLALTGLHLR